MSKDAKLDKTCDHRIIEEQVQIEDDLKTIPIPRTLVSSTVTLYINDYLISSTDPKNGWAIQEDPRSLYTKKSKIVLNNKRKSKDDYFYVSYNVLPEFCPKCIGLRILNDESYSKLGKLNVVEKEAKLLQEVKKGLTTELGSNAFHSWIGTQIYQLIGSKVFNVDIIKARIIQEISRYLEKYLDIQTQQALYQTVDPREAFYQTLDIQVDLNPDVDISYWTVSIIFQNRTGAELLYEKDFKIPGPISLLYGKN